MGEHTINMEIKLQKKTLVNKIVILVCIIVFIIYSIIYSKTKDDISTMILLGTDYKTFTLGLGEYYRLITSGFCHFNILHLICNMISLYSLGSFVEMVYGSKRYLIYLFCGILIGSLTCGILNSNTIVSGISSALYTFFTMLVLFVLVYKQPISSNFFPILFLNVSLNFLSNVSWQSHLGGAVAGFIFFYIDYYQRTKNKLFENIFKVVLIMSIVFLSFKYYQTKDKISLYKGTDFQYLDYLETNVPSLYGHYQESIYNYYMGKRK